MTPLKIQEKGRSGAQRKIKPQCPPHVFPQKKVPCCQCCNEKQPGCSLGDKNISSKNNTN